MFDRGTRGRFLRTLSHQKLAAEPGVGSCPCPWAAPYRRKKISGALRRGMRALSLPTCPSTKPSDSTYLTKKG